MTVFDVEVRFYPLPVKINNATPGSVLYTPKHPSGPSFIEIQANLKNGSFRCGRSDVSPFGCKFKKTYLGLGSKIEPRKTNKLSDVRQTVLRPNASILRHFYYFS